MNDLMEFLKQLEEKDNRGIKAVLRRGLIPGQNQRTWPLLARFNGIGDGYREKVVQTIAGLFALHPVNREAGNFGKTCQALMNDDERTKLANGEEGPLSRRFHHLLAADGEEILDRVVRFVMRIKSHETLIPVDYKKLRDDLLNWQTHKKDKVRTEWAKGFWSVQTDDKESDA